MARTVAKGAVSKAQDTVETVFRNADNAPVTGDDIGIAYMQMLNGWLNKDVKEGDSLLETSLDVGTVVSIVTAIPGDGDDIQRARMAALIAADEAVEEKDTTPVPAPGQVLDDKRPASEINAAFSGHSVEAIKFGHAMSPELQNVFDKAADDKEGLDGTPLIAAGLYWRDLVKYHDGDDVAASNYLMRLPVPGSRHDKAPFKLEDGTVIDQNKDGYNGPRSDYWKRADNTGKDITGRYYAEEWDATTKGQLYLRNVGWYKNPVATDHKEPCPAHILAIKDNAKALDAGEARWKGRRTTAVNKLARTVRFMQQRHRLDTEMPRVGWKFANDTISVERMDKNGKVQLIDVKDDKGNVRNPTIAKVIEEAAKMPKPFVLYVIGSNKQAGDPTDPLSLTTFCNVNIDVALKNGGELKHLTATVQREKDTGTGTQADKLGDKTKIRLTTVEQVESYVSALSLYTDRKGDHYTKHANDITVMLANDDKVRLVGEFLDEWNELFLPFRSKFETMKQNDLEAIRAKVLAEAEKAKAPKAA